MRKKESWFQSVCYRHTQVRSMLSSDSGRHCIIQIKLSNNTVFLFDSACHCYRESQQLTTLAVYQHWGSPFDCFFPVGGSWLLCDSRKSVVQTNICNSTHFPRFHLSAMKKISASGWSWMILCKQGKCSACCAMFAGCAQRAEIYTALAQNIEVYQGVQPWNMYEVKF